MGHSWGSVALTVLVANVNEHPPLLAPGTRDLTVIEEDDRDLPLVLANVS